MTSVKEKIHLRPPFHFKACAAYSNQLRLTGKKQDAINTVQQNVTINSTMTPSIELPNAAEHMLIFQQLPEEDKHD